VLFFGFSVSSLTIHLFAGAWVDRLRRRSILIAADLVSAAAIASIPVSAAAGVLSFAQLFVVFTVLGLVRPFFWSGFTAYVPTLVRPDQLVEANGKLSASESGAAVVGPGVAGVLVDVMSAPFALVVDAASFVVSAAFLGSVRIREPAARAAEGGRRILDEIREGISMTLGHRVLRWITLLNALRVVGTIVWPNYVIFALRVLRVSPLTFGLVTSLGALGFLGGSLLAPRLTRRFGIGRTLVGASFLLMASPFFMPFAPAASPWAPVLLIGAAVVGATGDMVMIVTLESYLQAVTPRRMIGRVSATSFFLSGIGFLVGPLVGGFLGEAIGIRETIFVAACLHSLWPLFMWRSPLRTLHEMPATAEGSEASPSQLSGPTATAGHAPPTAPSPASGGVSPPDPGSGEVPPERPERSP
jgi:MFS family permease